MARTVSASFRSAAYAQETAEAWLVLLTLSHPNLDPPLRVTSDAVETVSRGETFLAYPFQIVLPSQTERQAPRARLIVDNVDRQIVAGVRALPDAASVLLEIVLASDPDTVEIDWPDFQLRDVFWDALVVEGELSVEHLLGVRYPGFVYSPATHPGLFGFLLAAIIGGLQWMGM